MTNETLGLSLDMSRKSTGVAWWKGDKPISTDIIALPDGYLGEQLRVWREHVRRMFASGPDWVAYEDVRAVSKQHGMIQFGMVGILLLEAAEGGVTVLPFAQPTVKKALAGTGKADKPMMVAAAQQRWPNLGVTSHDVADALGVGVAFLATQ